MGWTRSPRAWHRAGHSAGLGKPWGPKDRMEDYPRPHSTGEDAEALRGAQVRSPGRGPCGACTAQRGPVASRSELRPGHLFTSTLRPRGQGGGVSREKWAGE